MAALNRPCLLRAEHVVEGFDCGNPNLNHYLKEMALKNHASESARTFVVLENMRVIAYYTLSSSAVLHTEAPGRLRRNRPDPIPAVLLGRFAVDVSCQGRKLGSALLHDALLRVANVSMTVGIAAVIVDAISEAARRFYMERGFTAFTEESMRLYILMKDLRKTIGVE